MQTHGASQSTGAASKLYQLNLRNLAFISFLAIGLVNYWTVKFRHAPDASAGLARIQVAASFVVDLALVAQAHGGLPLHPQQSRKGERGAFDVPD